MDQKEFQKRIGRNIRIARRMRFYTYRTFSLALGVTHPTAIGWEKGKRPIPLYYLYKISQILNIPINLLLVLDAVEEEDEQ